MRRIALLVILTLMTALPLPAHADGGSPAVRPKLVAMVPLLPLADGDHPDIDDLMTRHWRGYWRVDSEYGFGPADIRAGRIDLDGDGEDELVVLINKPKWRGGDGQPFVIATWRNHAWLPVGWGWADVDGIFVTDEVGPDGWHTLDAGKFLMRWTSEGYRRDPK